jgi:hypothetical protein
MRRALVLLLLAGCGGDAPAPGMSFTRAGFYDAPFPSDDLRRADGTVDVSRVPNPTNNSMIGQGLGLIARDARGFAQAGAIYFRSDAVLDPASLPDLAASIAPGAPLFLVGLDDLRPVPIDVAYLTDGGPYGGGQSLLALLPLQGAPMRPHTRYAAVVTRKVKDLHGRALAQASAVADLAAGRAVAGLVDPAASEYRDAIATLAPLAAARDLAALAVFTTDDPVPAGVAVRDDALANHPLSALESAPALTDTFPDYCVFRSTIEVPVYQSGTPPYKKTGGDWLFDDAGHPIFDHTETANLYFTVPRQPIPAAGWPTVMFVRTGGGGDRPLVDRGYSATPEFGTPVTPGTGPAQYFARAGFAGVQIDGPLGGLRNTTMADEQFLIFNVFNASALRDNVRESAMELSLLARALPSLGFVATACPGTDRYTLDPAHLAIMGHSMGAWIAPLAMAWEPAFGAAVLSGAGGSYVANVMDKQHPLTVKPLAEALLDFTPIDRELEQHDPALMIIQWAAEPSDPQVYDAPIVRSGRQVLMLQGIVDHYILPSIANATSLALGLDEAGPAYDADNAEEQMLKMVPLGVRLPLVGRAAIGLPAKANRGATAVVVQHPGDALEDGHEVVFQTDPPKHQYRCFLQSWLSGTPSVPPDGIADAPCP